MNGRGGTTTTKSKNGVGGVEAHGHGKEEGEWLAEHKHNLHKKEEGGGLANCCIGPRWGRRSGEWLGEQRKAEQAWREEHGLLRERRRLKRGGPREARRVAGK